jgi:NADP-dependent 3-hydroxy acid dehydrogenase YdfG
MRKNTVKPNNAIVITGTSSGIGKACALYLDELGYKVYAGVRKQVDGDNRGADPHRE